MESTNTETPVTGERRASSAGTAVSKPSFDPIATGDYTLKILGDKVTVAAPSQSNPESVPYINARFEVLDSALTEGGKNRLVFPRFFLKNTPTAKGNVPWKGSSGLNGLAKAIGEEFDVPVIDYTTIGGTTFEILEPVAVKAWLASKDGMTFKAHVKAVKGGEYVDASGNKQTRNDGNEIAYYIVLSS